MPYTITIILDNIVEHNPPYTIDSEELSEEQLLAALFNVFIRRASENTGTTPIQLLKQMTNDLT